MNQEIKQLLDPAIAGIREHQTLIEPLSTKELEDFRLNVKTFGNPLLTKVCDEAMNFCRRIAPNPNWQDDITVRQHEPVDCYPPYWLSLLGASGTGKTHVALRITEWVRLQRKDRMFIRNGEVTYFKSRSIKWRVFVDAIMQGRFSIVESLIAPDYLYIDEIGAEHAGTRAIVYSKFGEVCDARLGKWTVMTANQSLRDLTEIDARIASRMIRGTNGSKNVVVDLGDNVVDYATR